MHTAETSTGDTPPALSCCGRTAMRVPVGDEEWYLCDRSDQPDEEYIEFRGSRTLALQWARQIQDDLFAQGALRTLLGGPHPPLSDEQIVQEVAWRLTSGVWLARRNVVERPSADRGVPQEAPAFPQEERRPPPQRASGREPERPLF